MSVSLLHRATGIDRAVTTVVLSPQGSALAQRVTGFRLTDERVREELAHEGGDDLARAFRLLLRNPVSRGGLLTASSGLLKKGESGMGLSSRWYPDTLAKRIGMASALRDRISVEHGDGVEVLQHRGGRSDTVFVIDPPYVGAPGSPGTRLYRHAELDHAAVFASAGQLQANALMSYQDHPLVRSWAAEHQLEGRKVGMRTTHHTRATELLIGRDLGWVHGDAGRPRPLRHRDSVSCRVRPVEPPVMSRHSDSSDDPLVALAAAATELS